MNGELKLYVAAIVQLEEDIWYEKDSAGEIVEPLVIDNRKIRHNVHSHLFTAASHDAAYDKAMQIVEGSDDKNHDGPGHLKQYSGIGIHQLTQIWFGPEKLVSKLDEYYGAYAGVVEFVDAASGESRPRIRNKLELDIFTTAKLGV